MQLNKRQDMACEIRDLIALLDSAKETILADNAKDTDKLLTLAGRELKKLQLGVRKSVN